MSGLDIAVIDYGMGNLRSVDKALEYVLPQARVKVTSDPDEIFGATRVVFPGQGAARDCMHQIVARGLREVIREAARSKPFLGICMGMQVLFDHSAEGDTPCLGLIQGEVVRFPKEEMCDAGGDKLKVPHMGWNNVHQAMAHPLWAGIPDGSRFYYVHSYFVRPAASDVVAGYSHYPFPFTSAIASGNIFAVQFHPEKSAEMGLKLLRNFVDWDPFAAQVASDHAASNRA